MSQPTVLGDAEVTVTYRVDRADGTVEFYRATNGVTTAITQDEYESEQG